MFYPPSHLLNHYKPIFLNYFANNLYFFTKNNHLPKNLEFIHLMKTPQINLVLQLFH